MCLFIIKLKSMEPVESKEAIAATEIKIKDEVVSDVEDDVHEEGDDDEDDDDDDKTRVLTHKDAMEEFKNGLAELIIGDSLLNDLQTGITLEEVNSLIALEHGQAITVNVRRGDGSVLNVVVVQNGTIIDLKKAIQRHVALKQQREDGTQHISWHYIWKTYWLYFQGQKLMDDHRKIKEYGIGNKDEVTFIKRLRQK